MIRIFFILIISLTFISLSHSAKLYKIVDSKTGEVTFSQYPPAKASVDGDASIEGLSVGGGGTTRISVDMYGAQVCGSIALPRPPKSNSVESKFNYASRIDTKLKRWRSNMRNIEKNSSSRSRSKFNRGMNQMSNNKYTYTSSQSSKNRNNQHYSEQQNKTVESMRDLRCAISWAENRNTVDSSVKEKYSSEKDRYKNILDKLENKMREHCGERPPYDPSNRVVEGRHTDWYQCSSDYRADISKFKRKVRRNEY